MDKVEWINDMLPFFKVLYPEKNEQQIIDIITRGYDKFASIIREL